MNPKLKTVLKWIYYIGIVAILVLCFDTWGVKGVLIGFSIIIAIRLWSARQAILMAIRQIESMIWGKPLDKELWNKEEFKNAKPIWIKK